MAIAEEILETRLEVLGLQEFRNTMGLAARSFGIFKEGADEAALSQLGMGLAVGAAGVGIAAKLLEMGKAAGEEEAVFERAAGNFESFGHSLPESKVREFSEALQQQTGIAKGAIAANFGLLGSFGLTGEQAEKLALPILNTAEALKAQGVSAEALTVAIGRALRTGNIGRLARLLPVNELRFQSDRIGAILEALEKRGGDAALRFKNTLPGSIQAANSALESLKNAIGEPLIGPLAFVAKTSEAVASGLERIPGAAGAIAAGLGLASVAGIAYSVRAGIAVAQTVNLARAHLEAAAAARTHAVAEGQAAAAVTVEAEAAGVGAAATGGGGILGRLGGAGGIAKSAGLIGGGILAGEGLRALGGEDRGFGGTFARVGGRALEGGAIGALAGPIGIAVGGALGALEGGIEEIASNTRRTAEKAEDPQLAELKKQNEMLERQLDELKNIRRGVEINVEAGPAGTRGALNGAAVLQALGRAVG